MSKELKLTFLIETRQTVVQIQDGRLPSKYFSTWVVSKPMNKNWWCWGAGLKKFKSFVMTNYYAFIKLLWIPEEKMENSFSSTGSMFPAITSTQPFDYHTGIVKLSFPNLNLLPPRLMRCLLFSSLPPMKISLSNYLFKQVGSTILHSSFNGSKLTPPFMVISAGIQAMCQITELQVQG